MNRILQRCSKLWYTQNQFGYIRNTPFKPMKPIIDCILPELLKIKYMLVNTLSGVQCLIPS